MKKKEDSPKIDPHDEPPVVLPKPERSPERREPAVIPGPEPYLPQPDVYPGIGPEVAPPHNPAIVPSPSDPATVPYLRSAVS